MKCKLRQPVRRGLYTLNITFLHLQATLEFIAKQKRTTNQTKFSVIESAEYDEEKDVA